MGGPMTQLILDQAVCAERKPSWVVTTSNVNADVYHAEPKRLLMSPVAT